MSTSSSGSTAAASRVEPTNRRTTLRTRSYTAHLRSDAVAGRDFLREPGHVAADVAAEQVTDGSRSRKSVGHDVESGLQQPEFGSVEDGDRYVVVAALHALHAAPDLVDGIRGGCRRRMRRPPAR